MNGPFYQLGSYIFSGEHVTKNVETAVHYLGLCAEKGNQYAQYVLGSYISVAEMFPVIGKGSGISDSIRQNKEICMPVFLLEHLDAYQDPSLFLGSNQTASSSGKAVFAKKYRDQWK